MVSLYPMVKKFEEMCTRFDIRQNTRAWRTDGQTPRIGRAYA